MDQHRPHLNGTADHAHAAIGKSHTIEATQNISSADFEAIVQSSQPTLLRDLDIGSCAQTWTNDYLRDKIGPDHQIVVHQAHTPHLSFQPGKRNFEYAQHSFSQFLESVESGEQVYFRATSTKGRSKPADFFTDFPSLSSDFVVPPALGMIEQNIHSSVLRISGPVAMWLHYDVMANVLFQIRDTKELLLFPPSDVDFLQVPAGSSSSELDVADIFALNSATLAHLHPHKVTMQPGDALFIPPLWLHCARPADGASVSLNVFWRDLEDGYAAGRDIYGNRDVQAYEDGRKTIDKMVNRFETLPAPMADFYLRRLTRELESRIQALQDRM